MALSFLQEANDTTNGSSFSFASQNLGTAASDRHIIVAVTSKLAGTTATTISSITVGGVTATITRQKQNAITNSTIAALAIAAVPSGTTGTVVVTFSGTVSRCSIGLWRATGLGSATATDSKDSVATAPTSGSMTVSGGFAIGVAAVSGDGTTSTAWTNATERYDVLVESLTQASGADAELGSGTVTLTATFTNGGAEPVGVFATWPATVQVADTGAGADALAIDNQFEVGADTGSGADALAISNQFEVGAEVGAGVDALAVSELVSGLDETGTGVDALALSITSGLSSGRLWVGRFRDAEPEYTIENEIIQHEQIDDVRLRPNVISVDGNDDSWTEYDRGDLTSRDTAINSYIDQPELLSPGAVRQRAIEELNSALRANSPGGEVVWQPWFTRMDKIFWIAEDGSKYESRIEGLAVQFNQSTAPSQRATLDTGLMVFCPPEDAVSYVARDLFEREDATGLGEALTGGEWVIY